MPRIIPQGWTYKTPQWVIFDLDGTLADIEHRLHHLKSEEKDWDAFNAACSKDSPIGHIIQLLYMMREYGKSIAIFTGRDGTYEERTREWLKRFNIGYDLLVMRTPRDHRSDDIVKKEMLEKNFQVSQIWLVIEDRARVVGMWRGLGLTCLQCKEGDY